MQEQIQIRSGIRVGRWRVAALLGSPVLFLLHAETPWALALWGGDASRFYEFWGGILLLHLATTTLVFWFLKSEGLTRKDIGLASSGTALAVSIAGLCAAGLIATIARELSGYASVDTLGLQAAYPAEREQRVFWIALSLSAGFCEEIVYRGFLIRALQGQGMPLLGAVALSSIAFATIHGLWSWEYFGATALAGGLFAALFLATRRLLPVILIHASIDLLQILELDALFGS